MKSIKLLFILLLITVSGMSQIKNDTTTILAGSTHGTWKNLDSFKWSPVSYNIFKDNGKQILKWNIGSDTVEFYTPLQVHFIKIILPSGETKIQEIDDQTDTWPYIGAKDTIPFPYIGMKDTVHMRILVTGHSPMDLITGPEPVMMIEGFAVRHWDYMFKNMVDRGFGGKYDFELMPYIDEYLDEDKKPLPGYYEIWTAKLIEK